MRTDLRIEDDIGMPEALFLRYSDAVLPAFLIQSVFSNLIDYPPIYLKQKLYLCPPPSPSPSPLICSHMIGYLEVYFDAKSIKVFCGLF
jgi:hypothetical protein